MHIHSESRSGQQYPEECTLISKEQFDLLARKLWRNTDPVDFGAMHRGKLYPVITAIYNTDAQL